MLTLEIVTPAGRAYTGDVEMVTLPAAGGQIGVRPHHAPLVTRIEPGELLVRRSGRAGDEDEVLAVGEGLVAITGDRVSIVTDMAIKSSDIDEAKVEDARQRALARLADKISDEEVATVNASLARAVAQLHVRKRRRR